jgi:hypothetical protein
MSLGIVMLPELLRNFGGSHTLPPVSLNVRGHIVESSCTNGTSFEDEVQDKSDVR